MMDMGECEYKKEGREAAKKLLAEKRYQLHRMTARERVACESSGALWEGSKDSLDRK